jgi:mannitol/fructose-specific phosphotransferase system IIA component (Ntr-type)
MKLSDALSPDRIELDLASTEKIAAIREMIALMGKSFPISDPDELLHRVLDREAIQSTGVDRGVAIPHARTDEIDGVVAALGISRSGMDYGSLDGYPVGLIILILSSETATAAYLSVLSRTARIFDREDVREQITEARSPDEILDLIRQQEPI